MDHVRHATIRPAGEDGRAALVEFGLTTAFMSAVFSLVRWGIGSMAPAASATAVSQRPTRWAVVQPGPGWTGPSVAAVEAATLAVIVALMCWVSVRRRGWPLAWIAGGLFGLQGAVFGTLTGGSANPARQLGPALFSGDVHLLAVYLIAPVAGGMLAGWASRGVRDQSPGPAGHHGRVPERPQRDDQVVAAGNAGSRPGR